MFWTAVLLPLIAYREAFGFHAGTGMDTMLSALANAFLVFATLRLAESPKVPTVPVFAPQSAALPGASVLLVPGAKPTTVMSNGEAVVVVPGTRKATPLMGSLLYLVPVVFQQVVLKELNGTKLGPFGSVMVAHQRLVGSVAPLTP